MECQQVWTEAHELQLKHPYGAHSPLDPFSAAYPWPIPGPLKQKILFLNLKVDGVRSEKDPLRQPLTLPQCLQSLHECSFPIIKGCGSSNHKTWN